MADPKALAALSEGPEQWRAWKRRMEDPVDLHDLKLGSQVDYHLSGWDFRGANLQGADLTGVDLSNSNLYMADLRGARFSYTNMFGALMDRADLRGATFERVGFQKAELRHALMTDLDMRTVNLNGANLYNADLRGTVLDEDYLTAGTLLIGADLSGGSLRGAWLTEADLTRANFSRADLTGANLERAQLVETNFSDATLLGCRVYGCSVWNVVLNGADQRGLRITPQEDPEITVDNLEVAQFAHLLLRNESIRRAIEALSSKLVLILGRFSQPRKKLLDAARSRLREYGYVTIMFDFEKPHTRDTSETIHTLASLCRFVIADITAARSICHELAVIVPSLPSVAVLPIIKSGHTPWGMWDSIYRRESVLPPHEYRGLREFLADLPALIDEVERRVDLIGPAQQPPKQSRSL